VIQFSTALLQPAAVAAERKFITQVRTLQENLAALVVGQLPPGLLALVHQAKVTTAAPQVHLRPIMAVAVAAVLAALVAMVPVALVETAVLDQLQQSIPKPMLAVAAAELITAVMAEPEAPAVVVMGVMVALCSEETELPTLAVAVVAALTLLQVRH
jgi:hypothetical protein